MLKINSTQNKQIIFRAKLNQKTKKLLETKDVSAETKTLLKAIENDEQTKDVTLDVIRCKRNKKDFFSFNIILDETSAKLMPHHPINNIMKPKLKRFFWQNIDEMFQSSILQPTNIQKLKKASITSRKNCEKYFQLDGFDDPNFGSTLHKWLDSMFALLKITEVKRK